ncbi:hypothetical protein SBOR_2662 [Sclerotinia borealis F-4128]|uniref:Uncharacterized protein n=1 Tax=Sclerotinia borealis (strain F-4128) TaxID=1432307 RepID=W9CR62_SCLBF|nr:hypothetical protein SBOR_2662 [Sclerotinia borealis F-4128]
MSLQKTGSRFKQMVFHRESNSADGFFEYDRNTNNRQPESFFWISENPKSDKRAVRRNTAIMVREQPQIRNDFDQTTTTHLTHLPLSPLHFDWGFNENSASGSVDGSVGNHGSVSTPNLTKVETTPIGDDIGSLSMSMSKSKSESIVLADARTSAVPVLPTQINDNNQHHNRQPRYHYFPQTLTPPKVNSGDAQVATQTQTCSSSIVFSDLENLQQASSNLRLHSSTRGAQATLSDNKLMKGKGKGSNINLFLDPNNPSLFNHLIPSPSNDKGNPTTPNSSSASASAFTSTSTTTAANTTTKKLIRSTKSYDRFNIKSKDKSFLPFQYHHKKSISTSASCSDLQNMVEFTDNVEQLIRETDEAFQAVGFALGDAKAATRGYTNSNTDTNTTNTSSNTNTHTNNNTHTNTHINTTYINTHINTNTRQNRRSGSTGNKSIARTNSISKRNQMQNPNFNSLKELPSLNGLSGKSPVPRSIIASKAKKSNSPKPKKITATDKASRKSLPHPHSSARWNLGDVTASMADVFKGKFTRLEADEMLTPDRLQQLEEKAEKARLDNERKASLETAQNEASRSAEDVNGIGLMEKSHRIDGDKKFETNVIISPESSDGMSPTEPFHLEDLLPRINNDKVSNSSHIHGSAASSLPYTPVDTAESSEKDQRMTKKPLHEIPNPDYAEIDAIEQAFEDLNFPSPPNDSPPRHPRSRSNTGLTNFLPTIPEISPLHVSSRQTPKRSFSQDSEYSQDSSTSSVDYIELPCTPYTLTSPLFRHGPIRLEHVYHNHHRDSEPAPDLEEALDWTAFQMAISGTMDDGTLGASEESIWEADEAEVDSILDWWTGFGYPGIGRLVTEAPASRRKRGKSLAASEADKCSRKYKEGRDHRATTIGLGLGFPGRGSAGAGTGSSGRPKTPEYKGGLWVETIRDSAPQVVDQEMIRAQTQTLMRGARRDVVLKVNVAEPKIDDYDDDDDNDSLPPSPINLVKIKDEYIPMGYNLGHDLGDFLNWETYHHVQSLFGEDEGRNCM